MARKLNSWLAGLKQYVENTEAPRQFWLWSGIFTISSAMQRKVWLPFGMENIYPNLYILTVAPPAARKALPASLAKKMLLEIGVRVSRDSTSRRAITKELAKIGTEEVFQLPDGTPQSQSAMAVISKEMSSLLMINPKEVIEILTDLYDSYDIWDLGLKDEEDKLYNICLGCYIATTPTWLTENLPESSVGGGYTSRNIIVWGDEVYKRVTLPSLTKQQTDIYSALIHDLSHIHTIIGPFKWDKEAYAIFDNWYQNIDQKIRTVKDQRLHPFIGRMHICILKTAMTLRIDYSDSLILTPPEITRSIEMMEEVLATASNALGGHGPSRYAAEIYRVRMQIQMLKQTTFRNLLAMNLNHLIRSELKEVIETLAGAGLIRLEPLGTGNDYLVLWKGEKKG